MEELFNRTKETDAKVTEIYKQILCAITNTKYKGYGSIPCIDFKFSLRHNELFADIKSSLTGEIYSGYTNFSSVLNEHKFFDKYKHINFNSELERFEFVLAKVFGTYICGYNCRCIDPEDCDDIEDKIIFKAEEELTKSLGSTFEIWSMVEKYIESHLEYSNKLFKFFYNK